MKDEQLHFDDTRIAFESKSNFELRRTKFIFNTMKYPWMVKFGVAITSFSLRMGLPIKGIIKKTLFSQFCGGESINDCSGTIENLGKYGVETILDYGVEGQENEKSFDSTKEEALRVIDFAQNQEHISFSVVKMSGLASATLLEKIQSGIALSEKEEASFLSVKNRIHELAAHCARNGLHFMVDAEETWIQDVIDELVIDLILEFNKEKPVVFNTYQFYRKDSLDRMKKHYTKVADQGGYFAAKIVRGAYLEKERERAEEKGYPDPINDTKERTDELFDDAISFIINHVERFSVCVGTHNEKSSAWLVTKMKEKGLEPNDQRVYASQLLGMSDNISFKLSKLGLNVAKYVPYGPVKMVMPYLFRRAEENTSIAGQSGRELSLVKKEINRRKHQ